MEEEMKKTAGVEERVGGEAKAAENAVSASGDAKKRPKWPLVVGAALLCGLVVGGGFWLAQVLKGEEEREIVENKEERKIVKAPGLNIVPTMLDELTSDAAWCGTFQLVWNDMKNEVVGGDVVYAPQLSLAENLNKETFTADMLSPEYYYKKWGLKNLELKAEIEEGIATKFNETSDVLNDIDWSEDALNDPNDPDVNRYLFYVMLRRKFEYPKELTKLEDGEFNGKNGVKYFGIDGSTADEVRDQVEVQYYNSEQDFAILVGTKGRDELIFVKSPEGVTFDEIYRNADKKVKSFAGERDLLEIDRLKIPNLDFDEKRTYTEFEGKKFPTRLGRGEIIKAIQTIRFSLDEKGGEVKSEAVIDMLDAMSALEDDEPEKPRYFYLDNTFAMFIREKGKSSPYFAARVDDIEKFQSK